MAETIVSKLGGGKKITETKNFIRLRVRNPNLFKKESMRTHDIGRKGYTKRLSGKLKTTNKWATQAFIFSKANFGRRNAIEEAKKYAKPRLWRSE